MAYDLCCWIRSMQAASRKTLKGWLVLTDRIQNCQSIVGSLHLLMTCVFDMCACNHQEVLKGTNISVSEIF
jgi:hypothetical protein